MKRITTLTLCLFAILACASARAQAGATPAPELSKLAYFAGDWTTDTTIAPGPWGSGGIFSDKVHTEWMKGGFFLISHSDYSMPSELGGPGVSLSVIGYDAEHGTYTQDRYSSTGQHITMTGKLAGNTWTWTGDGVYNGTSIMSRFTMTVTSPTSYTSSYEVSADGGATWMPFWQGKATRK